MYCIRGLTHACTFFLIAWTDTVEQLRSSGDESTRLESLRTEEVQKKSYQKQIEEPVALKQSEVCLELFSLISSSSLVWFC